MYDYTLQRTVMLQYFMGAGMHGDYKGIVRKQVLERYRVQVRPHNAWEGDWREVAAAAMAEVAGLLHSTSPILNPLPSF
jgi:hypothetical protein